MKSLILSGGTEKREEFIKVSESGKSEFKVGDFVYYCNNEIGVLTDVTPTGKYQAWSKQQRNGAMNFTWHVSA